MHRRIHGATKYMSPNQPQQAAPRPVTGLLAKLSVRYTRLFAGPETSRSFQIFQRGPHTYDCSSSATLGQTNQGPNALKKKIKIKRTRRTLSLGCRRASPQHFQSSRPPIPLPVQSQGVNRSTSNSREPTNGGGEGKSNIQLQTLGRDLPGRAKTLNLDY